VSRVVLENLECLDVSKSGIILGVESVDNGERWVKPDLSEFLFPHVEMGIVCLFSLSLITQFNFPSTEKIGWKVGLMTSTFGQPSA
jgi:hypothetical protein